MQAENKDWRARINETRRTYYFATTLDFIPRPEHHLTVALFGSPNFEHPDADVQRGGVHLEPELGARGAHEEQRRHDGPLDVEAARSPLAHRRLRRHAPRVLQRSLARCGAERPEPAGVPGHEPLGPREGPGLFADHAGQRRCLPALPRRPLPHGRLRSGQEVHRLPLDRRGQVDPPDRGAAATTSSSTAGGSSTRPSTRSAATRVRSARARADPNSIPQQGTFNTILLLHAAAGRVQPSTSAPTGSQPSTDLLYPPDYQDSLKANVTSIVERVLPAGQLQPAAACAT